MSVYLNLSICSYYLVVKAIGGMEGGAGMKIFRLLRFWLLKHYQFLQKMPNNPNI